MPTTRKNKTNEEMPEDGNLVLASENQELQTQLQEAETQLNEQENIIKNLEDELAANSQQLRQLTSLRQKLREQDEMIANLQSSIRDPTEGILRSMQTPQILRDIPCFTGDPIKLNSFIKSIDHLMPLLKRAESTPVWNIWMQAVRSKIVDEADSVLELYGTDLDWEEIKSTLMTHFNDKRDEVSLTRDLFKISQTGTVEDFYGKISNSISLLVNQLCLNEKNEDVIKAKKIFYQDLGLKVFLSGLKDPLGPIIRAQAPKTLKKALNLCLEERNYTYGKNVFQNNSNPQKPFYKPNPPQARSFPPMPYTRSFVPFQSNRRMDWKPSFNNPQPTNNYNNNYNRNYNHFDNQRPIGLQTKPNYVPAIKADPSARTRQTDYRGRNPPHFQIEEDNNTDYFENPYVEPTYGYGEPYPYPGTHSSYYPTYQQFPQYPPNTYFPSNEPETQEPPEDKNLQQQGNDVNDNHVDNLNFHQLAVDDHPT